MPTTALRSRRPETGGRAPRRVRRGSRLRLCGRWVGSLCLAGALASLASLGSARADDDLDDMMGGFDDDFDMAELDDLEDETPAWLARLPFGDEIYERVDLGGSLAAGVVWNYLSHTAPSQTSVDGVPLPPLGTGTPGRSDYGGLSRLDLDAFLQLDIRLPGDWQVRAEALGWYDFVYRIQGRRSYNGAVLDVYEWQVDSGEVYVTGPLHENLDVTVGRKIVNWGRSDTFRVVDVVNPLDNKEPGLVDIEDLRRPKAMVKLDATSGPWSGQLLVVPEHRYDRNPPQGSDFIPDIFANSALSGLGQIDDRDDFTGMPGLAGKFDGRFSGWDFSIYGAYVDQTARIPDFEPSTGLRTEANRIGMLGAAGNATWGAWLVKAETAWISNLRVLRFDTVTPALLNRERDRLDTMVGIEWYGPDQLTIALEIVNRHLFDHPGGPPGIQEFNAQDEFETGFRVSRPFFRERLDVTLLTVGFGERLQDGGLFRASADFELTDSLKLEGGWLVFFGGPRRTLGAFDSNDRIYGELKYSF